MTIVTNISCDIFACNHRHYDRKLLANLLFWQDVTDYGIAEERDADRLLRMGQAWSIFSRFIVDGAVWNIGECFGTE